METINYRAMRNKKVYFAHPMPTYGSKEESCWLDIIQQEFPSYDVINPANYPSHDMMFYFRLVKGCDAIAFIGESIGVMAEVYFSWLLGYPIYDLNTTRYLTSENFFYIESAFVSQPFYKKDFKAMQSLLN